jgi:hypothetical protein
MHHPGPVEAAVGEAGDRGDALFAHVVELGVGGELLQVGARGRLFGFELGRFGLAVGDLVFGDDERGDADQGAGESGHEEVGDRPGAQRPLAARPVLRWDQVHRAHR